MNCRELEKWLAEITAFSPSEIDQRFRKLREHGLLPMGARGPHAPTLSARHAAAGIIGIWAPSPAACATFTTDRLEARPELSGSKELLKPFQWCASFGDALTTILQDPADRLGVATVAVYRNWPRAVIEKHDGSRQFYGVASVEEGRCRGHRVTPTAELLQFNVSVLLQLAIDLEEEDEPEGEQI